MKKTVILAERPDLVLKLEKFGLVPEGKKGGIYEGIAKKWAQERKPPYDKPEHQALAERLPVGWEELTQTEMQELLVKLQEAIGKKKKENPAIANKGAERMLKSLAEVAFLGLSTVATLLVEHGIGILPDQDQKEKERAKAFSFELVLHLINGTGFLTTLFRQIAATTDTTKENRELIAEILKLAAVFLAILAVSGRDEEKLKRLMFGFKQLFEEGVGRIENDVSQKLAAGEIGGDKAERSSLYLQQARMALDKEDFEGLVEAFYGSLEMTGLSPELFIGEVEEMRKFAKHLRKLILAGLESSEREQTAISQAM